MLPVINVIRMQEPTKVSGDDVFPISFTGTSFFIEAAFTRRTMFELADRISRALAGERFIPTIRCDRPTAPEITDAAAYGSTMNPSRFDALEKIEVDEPRFVLMGRDQASAAAISAWIAERRRLMADGKIGDTPHEREKLADAELMVNRVAEYASGLRNDKQKAEIR